MSRISPPVFGPLASAYGDSINSRKVADQHAGRLAANLAADPGYNSALLQNDTANQQLEFQQRQFNQANANRSQMLQLLGLTPQTVGSGGLLGGTFFQSILGNSLPDVVGGISSNLPAGLGGGGSLSSPGFADSPGSPGSPGGGSFGLGGGGNGLLDQRLAFGRDILRDIGGLGGSERARIGEDYTNVGNSALAGLDARGLGSSNLRSATTLGVEKGKQRALGELEDRLLAQQVGAKQQIGEGFFGDVNRELDRGVERQRTGANLINALLGNALQTVNF